VRRSDVEAAASKGSFSTSPEFMFSCLSIGAVATSITNSHQESSNVLIFDDQTISQMRGVSILLARFGSNATRMFSVAYISVYAIYKPLRVNVESECHVESFGEPSDRPQAMRNGNSLVFSFI
jgi:hypothetical protein